MKKCYPLGINQCPHQTTKYKLKMQYVKSGDKRRRRQMEYLAQKMQEPIKITSEKYTLKRPHVYVCVSHHSSPMIMVSKLCSYTFTPAFSFMACTGTALTSRATEIWTLQEYKNMAQKYALIWKYMNVKIQSILTFYAFKTCSH